MASKAFLDANFLLDLVLKRPGFPSTRNIVDSAIRGEIELYTSPLVLHIIAYFTGQVHSQRHTKEILLTLLNDIKVIDCDHETALIALANTGIDDTEDALQYFTAVRFKMDYFISADKKLKKAALPQLPVLTASELEGLLTR
jgi:predicted nucleic acid-binding protein